MRTHTCCKCSELIYPGQLFMGSEGADMWHVRPPCNKAATTEVSEPPKPNWSDQKYHEFPPPRLLKSRVYISQLERECSYCERYEMSLISSGEEYIRETWLYTSEGKPRRRRIEEKFRHYPECPLPFDGPEDDQKYDEETQDRDVKLAA